MYKFGCDAKETMEVKVPTEMCPCLPFPLQTIANSDCWVIPHNGEKLALKYLVLVSVLFFYPVHNVFLVVTPITLRLPVPPFPWSFLLPLVIRMMYTPFLSDIFGTPSQNQ